MFREHLELWIKLDHLLQVSQRTDVLLLVDGSLTVAVNLEISKWTSKVAALPFASGNTFNPQGAARPLLHLNMGSMRKPGIMCCGKVISQPVTRRISTMYSAASAVVEALPRTQLSRGCGTALKWYLISVSDFMARSQPLSRKRRASRKIISGPSGT